MERGISIYIVSATSKSDVETSGTKDGSIRTRKMEIPWPKKRIGTSLQQREIEQGLIAFGGRWSLVASMYRYVIYNLEDMKRLAEILWDREIETFDAKDMDAWELEMMKNTEKRRMIILNNKT